MLPGTEVKSVTNLQLLLSIGIPSILVLLSWLQNNSRHDVTDKRIDDVMNSNHKDALEIMSMTALHERVAVVESRQSS